MKREIIFYGRDDLIRYRHIWRAKKIIDFDCANIKLECLENCGGFFTHLPISTADWRKDNPTKAKVEITKKIGFTKFKIFDDWGDIYIIKIPNKFYRIIQQATQIAIKENLISQLKMFP